MICVLLSFGQANSQEKKPGEEIINLKSKTVFFRGVEEDGINYKVFDEFRSQSIPVDYSFILSCKDATKTDSIFQNIKKLHFLELKKDKASIGYLMAIIKISPDLELSCLLPVIDQFDDHTYLKRFTLDLRSYELLIFFGKHSLD